MFQIRFFILSAMAVVSNNAFSAEAAPLHVLLVTGGCCHDYDFQTKALRQAAEKRGVSIEWTVVNEGGTGTKGEIGLYRQTDWAEDYDVVVHNECFADTSDENYIRNITEAHRNGANAVVIHCAMHTYRSAGIDDWREMLGVTSRHHEHQSNYIVRNTKPDHPVMKDFPEQWTTPKDELYIVEKVWPNTEVLASSISEKTGDIQPVIWTGEFGKARIFGTTFGHGNDTFEDDVFLNVVINGIVWAAEETR